MNRLLSFTYDGINIEFEVTYSKRKTITILVAASGKVSVRAPHNLTQEMVVNRVKGKAKWIIKKLNEVKDIHPLPAEKEFISGELFMYLGSNYPLLLDIDEELTKPVVRLLGGRFIVQTPAWDKKIISDAMECWYRNKAREQISERIEYYQPWINAKPNRVTIKNQKKRWGSCSSRGNLNFNWRIIMAPAEVIDYVVVHEMCHLIHLNHSRNFWELVASILPDYKDRKGWLRKNGASLLQD